MTNNEAAERLRDALDSVRGWREPQAITTLLNEALAAEYQRGLDVAHDLCERDARRATVEQIRELVDNIPVSPQDTFISHHKKVIAILDEEAAR